METEKEMRGGEEGEWRRRRGNRRVEEREREKESGGGGKGKGECLYSRGEERKK